MDTHLEVHEHTWIPQPLYDVSPRDVLEEAQRGLDSDIEKKKEKPA